MNVIDLLNGISDKVTLAGISELTKILISVVCTVWGILYVRKPKFYYLERNNIKLYQEIVDSIDGISITYKGQEIQENLRLVSGTIILKSHTDIKKDEIDKEISIASPDAKARWKHFEIINTNTDFNPNFSLNENKVLIQKSLLKRNDFISFTGLLDSRNSNVLIGHRIYNIIPGTVDLKEKNLSLYKAYSFAFPLLAIVMTIFYFSQVKPKQDYKASYVDHKFSRDDSITLETFGYDPIFFVNSITVDVDSKEEAETERQSLLFQNTIKEKTALVDTLVAIYDKNQTEQNKIDVLLAYIELLKVKHPFDNPYSNLKEIASDTLRYLLSDKLLDTTKLYRLNDSITLKYSANVLATFKEGSESRSTSKFYVFTVISSLGLYLFFLYYVTMSIIYIYKFFILKRLIKLYRKRSDKA